MFNVGETQEEQTKRFSDQRADALDRAHSRLADAEDLAKACELIVDVRSCMMFDSIHADFAVNEVLRKHKVKSIQLLAKMAQDTAEAALKKWKGT